MEERRTNHDEDPLTAIQPNEILIPDLPTPKNSKDEATRMCVNWKVKHNSIVRIGEIVALCSPSSHALPTDAGGSKSSVDGAAPAQDVCNNTISSSSAIIRPRKRNRSGITKRISTVTAEACIGDKGGKQSISTSSGVTNTIDSTGNTMKSISLTKKQSSENGGETIETIKTIDSSKTIQTTDITQTDRNKPTHESISIPIRATMDGLIWIYTKPQTRLRATTSLPPHENDAVTLSVCGKIEKCTHPAVIDHLCAVCGTSTKPQPNLNGCDANLSYHTGEASTTSGYNRENNSHREPSNTNGAPPKNTRDCLTVSGGVTIEISTDYGEMISSHSTKALHKARKLNLVLDLDHTLLHATNDARAAQYVGNCHDVRTLLLPVPPQAQTLQQQQSARYPGFATHYIKVRPHVGKFLDDLMDRFEISIYTAATGVYAHKVADMLCRVVIDYRTRLKIKNLENEQIAKDGKVTARHKQGEHGFCLDEEGLLALRQEVFVAERNVKDGQEYISRLNDKLKEDNKSDEAVQVDSTEKEQDETNKDLNESTRQEISSKEANEDDCSSKSQEMSTKVAPEMASSTTRQPMVTNGKAKKRRVTFSNVSDSLSANLPRLQEKLRAAEAREQEALELRKKIFGKRVVSRTDVTDLGCDVKSLKRVFPCGGMLAAIVDDREDVWANANNNVTGRKGEPPDNLLLVRPYSWKPFINYADVNNSAGEDISKQSKGTETQDGDDPTIEKGEMQLMWTYDILIRLHDRYYSDLISESERIKLTVPLILNQMRKDVLGASYRQAKIIFSGLVPLHVQHTRRDNNKYPRPPVVRYAQELGAEVMADVSSDVTHIVAARDGTEKIRRARLIPGCAIVTAKWLMECFWSISLRDIHNHLIGPPPIAAPSKPTKLLLSGSDSSEQEDGDSSEEEDDAFFANFDQDDS